MVPQVTSQSLPSLVHRAAQQLASAASAAEILEARDMASAAYTTAKAAARLAKAKGAHDELIAKAHRAQADALEIEAMAKRRLADEYDAAQDRGEIGQSGARTDLVRNGNEVVPPAAAAGLSRKDIHEARQIRDAEVAEPGVVRRVLDEALDAGDEPTKAAVRRATNHRRSAPNLSPSGKQLVNLRKAWRDACPVVRKHFLAEVAEWVPA